MREPADSRRAPQRILCGRREERAAAVLDVETGGAWAACGGLGDSRPNDGKILRHFNVKYAGVAVRGVSGQRKPARGQKQVGAIVPDRCQAHAGHGAAFFVGEWTRRRQR